MNKKELAEQIYDKNISTIYKEHLEFNTRFKGEIITAIIEAMDKPEDEEKRKEAFESLMIDYAWEAWKFAANAFRMHPNQKHTFSDARQYLLDYGRKQFQLEQVETMGEKPEAQPEKGGWIRAVDEWPNKVGSYTIRYPNGKMDSYYISEVSERAKETWDTIADRFEWWKAGAAKQSVEAMGVQPGMSEEIINRLKTGLWQLSLGTTGFEEATVYSKYVVKKSKELIQLLNNVQNVQVSDTRDDAQ